MTACSASSDLVEARPGSPLVTRTQALELASLGQADTVACSASQEGGLRWVDVVTSLSTLSTLSKLSTLSTLST